MQRSASARASMNRRRSNAVVVLAIILATGFLMASPASAVSYSLTDAVRIRSQPTAASPYNGVAPAGSSISVVCQQWGEAQGPNGNTLWLKVNGSGVNGWWVNDAWTTSPHLAADRTNGISGVAWCTSTPPPATAPQVWVGSPINGTWDLPAARGGDGPTVHHWLSNATDQGDWAVDLIAPADQEVRLYVAPQNTAVAITTKIDQVGAACGGGRNGGNFVTVGIYSGSTRIGSATYAHLRLAAGITQGTTINRWNSLLGYVGKGYPVDVNCWTGPHVHFQLFSNKNYACFNKGYSLGSALSRENFLGFTGGNVASAPRKACA